MTLILQLFAFTLFNLSSPVGDDIDSTQDQILVESSVVKWADSLFKYHANYKFEFFRAEYTDEYFIHEMRIELYENKIEKLRIDKENGMYTGTDEEFQIQLKTLNNALDNANSTGENILRAEYYLTHFWTNIQTRDGITVYYELIIKLDDNYQVIEVIENSSIGKKGKSSKIAYNKKIDLPRVIEK